MMITASNDSCTLAALYTCYKSACMLAHMFVVFLARMLDPVAVIGLVDLPFILSFLLELVCCLSWLPLLSGRISVVYWLGACLHSSVSRLGWSLHPDPAPLLILLCYSKSQKCSFFPLSTKAFTIMCCHASVGCSAGGVCEFTRAHVMKFHSVIFKTLLKILFTTGIFYYVLKHLIIK